MSLSPVDSRHGNPSLFAAYLKASLTLESVALVFIKAQVVEFRFSEITWPVEEHKERASLSGHQYRETGPPPKSC